jgi:hypothetical protein
MLSNKKRKEPLPYQQRVELIARRKTDVQEGGELLRKEQRKAGDVLLRKMLGEDRSLQA